MLESGRVKPRERGRLIQQCNIGLVEIAVEEQDGNHQLAFELPPARIDPVGDADVAELEAIIGCRVTVKSAPGIVNVGPIWVIVQMNDAVSVLALRPDFARLAELERRLGVTGLTVFGAQGDGRPGIEVRTFAPSCGVEEDPVCGSGNGSVAAFQWARGLLAANRQDYVASQGRRVGRDGRIKVNVDASGKVRVGGSCITCIDGFLTL